MPNEIVMRQGRPAKALMLIKRGIVVVFISGLQALEDPHVVEGPDHLFLFVFKGALCLFLLEMGLTACRRLGDPVQVEPKNA